MLTEISIAKHVKDLPVYQCFWCRKYLGISERTIDHLYSRKIRKELSPSTRNRAVISCNRCNQIRSKISSLYYLVRGNLATRKNVIKYYNTLQKEIRIFKDRILAMVPEDIREPCLKEIDFVLQNTANYQGKRRKKRKRKKEKKCEK